MKYNDNRIISEELSPFKEEWLSEEQHLRFIRNTKKMLENSKIGTNQYAKKNKRIESNL